MVNPKSFTALFAVLEAGAFLAFAWFGHRADVVMSKDGVGDVAAFEHYSMLAGFCFYAVGLFWLSSIVSAQLSPQPFRGHALFAVGLLMPVGFAVSYLSLII